MKIKEVLNVQLQDDHTTNGGVAFLGETVNDFIADSDILLTPNDYVSELNKVLVECGIKPILLTPLKSINENEVKNNVIHLLFSLFQDQEHYSAASYESMDKYYGYIGYTLDSEQLLHELNIHSTSDLQEMLIEYNGKLEGDLSDDEFEDKWLKFSGKKVSNDAIHLLYNLSYKLVDYSIESYENFYEYLCYELESETLLKNINVYNAHDLKSLIFKYDWYLKGYYSKDDIIA